MPALIPYFTDKFDLSYALAAMLLLAATLSSSIVQPLFGLWSDRQGALWLIPGGTALAAVGVGLAAVSPVPARARCWCWRVASALPRFIRKAPSSRSTRAGGSSRRECRTSTSAGTPATPSAPTRPRLLVQPLGLVGGLLVMVPVLLTSFFLIRLLPALRDAPDPSAGITRHVRGDDRRRAMAVLGGVIALRSVAWFTLLAFVPLWAESQGYTKSAAAGCCS